MNDLDPVITHAQTLAKKLVAGARKVAEQRSGYPAGGGGGAGSSTSDRTGTLAARRIDHGQDGCDVDYRELQDCLDRIDSIFRRAMPNNTASAHMSRQVPDVAGCRSCERVKDSLGRSLYEPVHRKDLCQWCLRNGPRIAASFAVDPDTPPLRCVEWRRDHPGRDLTDEVLARLMAGTPPR